MRSRLRTFAAVLVALSASAGAASAADLSCAPTMVAATAVTYAPLVFAPTVVATTAKYGIAYGPDPDPKMSWPVVAYFRRKGANWCLLGYAGDLTNAAAAKPVGISSADARRLMDAYNAAKAKAHP